jgi:hypothetical protein
MKMADQEYIEKYADLIERLDMLNKNMQELMEKAVPEEVKKAQAEIVAEYFPMLDTASKELEKVKANIEAQVKEYALPIQKQKISL